MAKFDIFLMAVGCTIYAFVFARVFHVTFLTRKGSSLAAAPTAALVK